MGTSEIVEVDVNGDSVVDLKHQIWNNPSLGIDPAAVRLTYNGVELDDDRFLSSYGIERDATIHLALRIRAGLGSSNNSNSRSKSATAIGGSSQHRGLYNKRACSNCHVAHAACGPGRPCERCRELGLADSCEDLEKKKRAQKRRIPTAEKEEVAFPEMQNIKQILLGSSSTQQSLSDTSPPSSISPTSSLLSISNIGLSQFEQLSEEEVPKKLQRKQTDFSENDDDQLMPSTDEQFDLLFNNDNVLVSGDIFGTTGLTSSSALSAAAGHDPLLFRQSIVDQEVSDQKQDGQPEYQQHQQQQLMMQTLLEQQEEILKLRNLVNTLSSLLYSANMKQVENNSSSRASSTLYDSTQQHYSQNEHQNNVSH